MFVRISSKITVYYLTLPNTYERDGDIIIIMLLLRLYTAVAAAWLIEWVLVVLEKFPLT